MLFKSFVPADYPSNQQFTSHFAEFLANGYKPSLGSVDIRFDHGCGDRTLKLHDVKFVDGQTKILICLAIVGFCSELEFSETQCQDPQLSMVLRSFTSIRCSYQHFDNDSDHFLHSLRSFTVFIVFTFKKCLIKQTFACHPSNSFASFLKTTFYELGYASFWQQLSKNLGTPHKCFRSLSDNNFLRTGVRDIGETDTQPHQHRS